jgi:GNAT superfamily N-acetyltransferase
MIIRKIGSVELASALNLAWNTFLEYEAPDYSAEGIDTFRKFIDDTVAVGCLEVFGGFFDDMLIGIIATRNQGSHIALFFVIKEYHRQGIGRKLFEYIINICASNEITVNSSPYAVEVYRRLGFAETDIEQLANRMRYTPMKYILSNR